MNLDRLDDWLIAQVGETAAALIRDGLYALAVILMAKWILF